MKITTLSKKEIGLMARLEFEGREIYTREEIVGFCGNKRKAGYLIKKLLEKRRLIKLIKGIYILIPLKAPYGQWMANEYLIARALAREANYYIGYSSVFNSYGFTDQVARGISIINDKYSLRKTIGDIEYRMIKVRPNRLYGLEKRTVKNEEIVFPKKERALIDVFVFYDIDKAYGILREQTKKINWKLLIEYLSLYPVQGVRRRMGYFLEKIKPNNGLLVEIKVGKKGFSPLYRNRPNKGEINKKWRVIVNG